LLGLASYEIRGGEKAEVFIRINDPDKLERLAEEKQYTNQVLKHIQERHRHNERLLEKFFATDMSDEERWELIEQYFLGNENYVRLALGLDE
jgi:cytidylate kinase